MCSEKTILHIDISQENVGIYKTIGWFLIFLNLTAFCSILLVDHRFAGLAFDYSFLTLMHLTALTCTLFALKDNNDLMLYPILVSLIAFICIPLFVWLFVVSSTYYCYKLAAKNITFENFDSICDDLIIYQPTWFHPISISLIMEKIFEFIIFRRLMKFFERQRLNAHFRAKDVSNAFSTNNDTDDEIIVYEKISRNSQGSVTDGARRSSPVAKAAPNSRKSLA